MKNGPEFQAPPVEPPLEPAPSPMEEELIESQWRLNNDEYLGNQVCYIWKFNHLKSISRMTKKGV